MAKKYKKALMLRAEVPSDKDRITFNSLEECDDMWTHLFCGLCEAMDIPQAEIWHYNSPYPREVQYTERVVEKWVPNIKNEFFLVKPEFDFIWARGGFKEYVPLIQESKAFKMYYGAGRRFFPIPSIATWLQNQPPFFNLVLVDSIEQKKAIEERLPDQKVSLFIKPAAENIFRPMNGSDEPLYDVCISFQLSSYTKRLDLALDAIIEGGFSALVIGDVEEKYKHKPWIYPRISFAGRWYRRYLPEYYSDCRMGLAVHSPLESCPRVIPEFLACGLPIIVTSDTLFWKKKYITKKSGILVKPEVPLITKSIQWILDNHQQYKPKEYYDSHLSLSQAVKYLANAIAKAEH